MKKKTKLLQKGYAFILNNVTVLAKGFEGNKQQLKY